MTATEIALYVGLAAALLLTSGFFSKPLATMNQPSAPTSPPPTRITRPTARPVLARAAARLWRSSRTHGPSSVISTSWTRCHASLGAGLPLDATKPSVCLACSASAKPSRQFLTTASVTWRPPRVSERDHCGLPWRAITTWVCSWPTSTIAVATSSVARSSRASAATVTRPRASAPCAEGQVTIR